MDTFFSAVLGDLLSRSISFVIDRYNQQQQSVEEESLQQLHRVLLRIEAIVEEADGRRITNRAILQQLGMLRDVMFRGYYFLDNFRYRIAQAHAQDEVGDLSPFSPLKRFCISARDRKTVSEILEKKELREMLGRLKTVVSDMQEFVVFVSGYPRMKRQPYCSYLLLKNCMFGRQTEQERVIRFLLAPHHLGAKDIDVLPIIGPGRVGKSTLVEHVCRDERVRKYFSTTVFYGPDSIGDGDLAPLTDTGEIKHRNPASSKQSLAIIELVDEMDDETWRRILQSLRGDHVTPVSKIIITSRSNKIATFGTTKALHLDFFPKEDFWYFFKTIAFGSTNPEEEPKLASICMEIAAVLNGSFMGLNIVASILNSNLSAHFWFSFLKRLKYFIYRHIHLLGEHPRDLYNANSGRTYIWVQNYCGDSDAVTYNYYQVNSTRLNDLPTVLTSRDILTGTVKPQAAKYEVLEWQSSIPPYYSYIAQYEILAQPKLMVPPRRKRSRALSEEELV